MEKYCMGYPLSLAWNYEKLLGKPHFLYTRAARFNHAPSCCCCYQWKWSRKMMCRAHHSHYHVPYCMYCCTVTPCTTLSWQLLPNRFICLKPKPKLSVTDIHLGRTCEPIWTKGEFRMNLTFLNSFASFVITLFNYVPNKRPLQ